MPRQLPSLMSIVSSMYRFAVALPPALVATISGHTSGDTYSWTGEFDVPVTFTDDEWIAEMRGYTERLFMSSLPIKLEEIRVRVA